MFVIFGVYAESNEEAMRIESGQALGIVHRVFAGAIIWAVKF